MNRRFSHDQNLHLHMAAGAGAGPVRLCHVIPQKISAHVAALLHEDSAVGRFGPHFS